MSVNTVCPSDASDGSQSPKKNAHIHACTEICRVSPYLETMQKPNLARQPYVRMELITANFLFCNGTVHNKKTKCYVIIRRLQKAGA
jgi:hypothetical protein